jgi:hypothetical protein
VWHAKNFPTPWPHGEISAFKGTGSRDENLLLKVLKVDQYFCMSADGFNSFWASFLWRKRYKVSACSCKNTYGPDSKNSSYNPLERALLQHSESRLVALYNFSEKPSRESENCSETRLVA